MLSPISATSLSSLRQLANKMEKILLVALENYGNTFVEPKVELGARFGHLVRQLRLVKTQLHPLLTRPFDSTLPRHISSNSGSGFCSHQPEAANRNASILAQS